MLAGFFSMHWLFIIVALFLPVWGVQGDELVEGGPVSQGGFVVLLVVAGGVLFVMIGVMFGWKRRLSCLEKRLLEECGRREHIEREYREQARRIRALYEVSTVSGVSDAEQINVLLDVACELLEMETGRLTRIDRDVNTFTVTHGTAPPAVVLRPGQVGSLSESYCSLALSLGTPLVVNHAAQSQLREHPAYRRCGEEAYLGAPVWVNGREYGVLSFASRRPRRRPFQESDVDLVNLMSRWVGVALERQFDREAVRKSA